MSKRFLFVASSLCCVSCPVVAAPVVAAPVVAAPVVAAPVVAAPVELLGDEASVLSEFEVFGPNAVGARKGVTDVAGQPFSRSVRVDVTAPDDTWWHVMARVRNVKPIRRGDALLGVFWVRGGVANMGGSEAKLDAFLKDVEPEPQQTYITITLSANPSNWQRIVLPMVAGKDIAPGQLQFGFSLGYKKQRVEIGGLSLLNYGQIPLGRLPKPTPQRFTYQGREANAPWRVAALRRIERIRKGDLRVRVVNAQGQPIRGASVRVEMTRHAFRWGTSLVPSYDLLPPASQDAGHKQSLPVLFSTFNHTAVDIDLKSDSWLKADEAAKARVIEALKILKVRGLTVHAHVLFWPSFDYNEVWRPLRNDPVKLRAAVRAFITDVVSRTAPYVDEWDVVNEPFGNRELAQLLGGTPAMIEFFRLAHRFNPRARLELNDYGLAENSSQNEGFGESAADEAHRAYDFNLIRELQAGGAPISGIGMQSHFNAPRDPAKVVEVFERFGKLGLRIGVSEFDAKFGSFADPRDEADFVRDFTIAAFSSPSVDSFTMWGFIDQMHWLGHAPLYRFDDAGQLQLKPRGRAWRDLVFKQWWTNASAKTDARGLYAVRGFAGDYTLTIRAGGRTKTARIHLSARGETVSLTL